MVSAAVLELVKLIQIPLALFADLNLDGSIYPPEKKIANNSCFNHIIVGGGTAGCALGGRLSENPNNTVLIIESGGNPSELSYLPPAFPIFSRFRKYDFSYTSTFDSYAANSQYNYTKLSAGRGLGGTSSINHFIYARGPPVDYNHWAKITGDSSWNYENVLPYFKKQEKLEDPEILDSIYRRFHGLEGPNAITRQPKDYADNYIQALNETGSRTPIDLTGYDTLGYAQSLFILNSKGVRQNTAYTYLTPVRLRSNLYVLRNTTVTKIIFEGKRAVGVESVRNGKIYKYRASKEVILSAGVFGSPKLLMLSGIGPKKHLDSLNISVKANLPVGENFMDQVSISLVHKTELAALLPSLYTLIPTQVPFPVITGLAALKQTQAYADYQMFLLLFNSLSPLFLALACADVFQFRTDLCDTFIKGTELHNSLYALLSKTRPHSTGYVRLRSKNPFDDPLITTGYFTKKSDLNDMVDYIIDYLKIENSTYFKQINATLVNPNLEQCKNYTFRTRGYWKCYVLHTAGSVYHNCGTCAMASVVDSKLRVYNVKNLRVVDASVIPELTHASPYADVLMIAEKAADMIKANSDKESNCRELYGTVEEENCDRDNAVTSMEPSITEGTTPENETSL